MYGIVVCCEGVDKEFVLFIRDENIGGRDCCDNGIGYRFEGFFIEQGVFKVFVGIDFNRVFFVSCQKVCQEYNKEEFINGFYGYICLFVNEKFYVCLYLLEEVIVVF